MICVMSFLMSTLLSVNPVGGAGQNAVITEKPSGVLKEVPREIYVIPDSCPSLWLLNIPSDSLKVLNEWTE
jgi:hypothetical protein